MTPQQYAAGWREPRAHPPVNGCTIAGMHPCRLATPPPCDGSGQLAWLDRDEFVTCPVCGRRVAAVLTGPLGATTGPWIVTHWPPAPIDEPRGRPADGPTLGL